MDAQTLIAKALARREKWVELEEGKRVRIRRPAETEMPALRGAGLTVDRIIACVVGWDGITEVDVLGEAVGAEDEVAFDPDLWAVLARDRADWVQLVAEAIVRVVTEHLEARSDAAKN